MSKVALVVLAGNDSKADTARVYNALLTAREAKEANDDVKLIFDGAGVLWAGQLPAPNHPPHMPFESVRDTVSSVCRYCAGSFGVREAVEQARLPLDGDYHDHPSLRSLIADGYQVITW